MSVRTPPDSPREANPPALWENPEARRVLDTMPEMFVAMDADYQIRFVNEALLNLTHGRAAAFVGKSHWALWPDMRGSIVEESYTRAFATRIPVRFQYHYPAIDVWIDVSAYPYGNYLHVYFRNITKEKQAEEELAARGDTFRALIDAVPHIAWVTDAEGAMVYINARWREFTGVNGMNLEMIRDAIHPDDIEHVEAKMTESRATGEYVPYDCRLRRHDGEYRWHRVKASPILAPDGKTQQWIGTTTDVHEEVLAFQSLRESEDHYQFRINSSPQIPWLADTEGRIYDFGEQWLALTGMNRETALSSQEAVIHPDDTLKMIEAWARSLGDGSPFHFDHRIRVADGSYHWVRSRAQARRDPAGNVIRWYGTTEDIHAQRQAEHILATTQESLALAMKGGRIGWWTRDLIGDVVTWSPELEELFGLEAGSFSGNEDNFLAYVLPEDKHLVTEAVGGGLLNKTDYSVEFRFRRVDGTQGWMEGRGRAIYDEVGQPTWIFGIGMDITERKESEQALRDSERRLRSLIEQSPVSIQTFAPNGECLSANAAWEALWETTADQLQGYNILKDPQLRAQGLLPDVEAAFAGEPKKLAPMRYDPAEIGREGRVRWVESRIYPVMQAGELLEVVLLLEDTTSRMDSFEALRQSEERFRTIAEVVPHFVWSTGADGETEYLNPQFIAYLGKTAEDLRGRGWLNMLHPEDGERADEAWSRARETGEPHEIEYRIQGADLHYRWFVSRGVAMRDANGKIVRWYGIVTDVQAQKEQAQTLERLVQERTLELEQAYREQESFSYSVSHDLRAPLRAIVGTARMLQEDHAPSLSPAAQDLLNRQSAAAVKMANLIDDLLEISRVGRRELEVQSVDLSAAFASAAAQLHVPDSIELTIEPDLQASGDPMLLQLAVQNLLENAVKFSPDGGRISVGQDTSLPDKPFFIRDEGVGFPMEFAHKLFQPFQRLHREDEFTGTGIGLATVHRIIERHGGKVWAESQEGVGSTFYFTVPS